MIPVAAVAASSTVNVRGRFAHRCVHPWGVHRDQSQQQEKHDARLDEHQDIRQGSSGEHAGTNRIPRKTTRNTPADISSPWIPLRDASTCSGIRKNAIPTPV